MQRTLACVIKTVENERYCLPKFCKHSLNQDLIKRCQILWRYTRLFKFDRENPQLLSVPKVS
jgi:hypothetical protein